MMKNCPIIVPRVVPVFVLSSYAEAACHRRFQRGSNFLYLRNRWFRCYAAPPTGYFSYRPTGLLYEERPAGVEE